VSPAAAAGATHRRRTSTTGRAEPVATTGDRSCCPPPPGRPARRHLVRIVPIAAALLLTALVLRTVGVMSGVTALELEAILGLPVWLLLWRRTRIPVARDPE
jgi:hypothetical protein